VISVEHVSKVYRRDSLEVPVLKNVNLVLEAGEFIALMGPSGSGKTTLLNLIAGLDHPTSGRIRIGGMAISGLREAKLAPWRARHVGFIFQLYNLIPVLTAVENVGLPLLLTRLKRKERIEHARVALGIVGLADRMDHYPRQLSGGQEQRVAIARAIVTDPVLLVADEPTGDLDARSAEEILDLLNRLKSEFGKTIVMVTHDPRAAARAHRVVHLEKGELTPAQMPRERVESFVAKPESPGLSSLEARFLQRVVAAMADYATARTVASPPDSPGEEALEGFEGLTTLDILELTQRLDSLFDHPSPARKPPEPPPPPPPRGSDKIELLERMLAESQAGAPSRPAGSPAAASRPGAPSRSIPPPPRRSGS
jgi:putative ABC transport system ATP-binding protein